ncbi:hypothetical protein [Nocardia yunnanensis]|uniref:hypothetical protein n=1 Tax=Nocardia yunnanensis TaxID=2382165 RepID=UPI003CCC8607
MTRVTAVNEEWDDRGMVSRTLCIAQESDADELLSTDDFALLVGMMLDQPNRAL